MDNLLWFEFKTIMKKSPDKNNKNYAPGSRKHILNYSHRMESNNGTEGRFFALQSF